MLESEPDKVAEVFTKTDGLGGVMQNMKNTLDTYAKTTGEPKGILIQQAGSPLSSLSLMNNTWQKEIDNLGTQIEKWQDKLSTQVDRYTQQWVHPAVQPAGNADQPDELPELHPGRADGRLRTLERKRQYGRKRLSAI